MNRLEHLPVTRGLTPMISLRTKIFLKPVSLFCVVAALSVTASAQEVQTAVFQEDDRIDQLQAELDRLRQRVEQASYSPYMTDCTPCVPGEGCNGQSSCPTGPIVEAGFAFVFAKPHMKESFERTTNDFATGTMTMHGFDFDYTATPRAWLQASSAGGPGIRASYWNYDEGSQATSTTAGLTTFPGASAVTVIFPSAISTLAPGDTLNTAMNLDVSTLDLEGTVPLQLGGVSVLGTAGLRYAEMDQTFRGTVVSGGSITQTLNWRRAFDGIGPTAGANLRYPLGDSGFSIVSNVRGSLLFGDKTIARTVVGDVTPAPNTTLPIVALNGADEVSGIFELALGVEWSRELGNQTEIFAQGMYEGQLWTAAGAPTLTFLGFEGFMVAIGIAR